MSQTIALELSDITYSALQHEAGLANTSPARLAAITLEKQFGLQPSPSSDSEQHAARLRFERHFGEVDLGHPTGVNNELIDADLASEYAATHEGT
jgi:hypothetical protein